MANRDLTPRRGSPVGWPSFEPFLSFREEMDRLFDDFLAPTQARGFPSGDGRTLRPSIDVRETDKGYAVTAELPGLEPKDVQVDVSNNMLTISGEKRSEMKSEEAGAQYSERSYGRFERRIPLPDEIDADKIEATFKNGLLKIELPKNPKAHEKTRKIEVKS